MNRSGTSSSRGLRAIGSIILALLLFAAFAASAQDITVTAADPPETEQGTLSLVVKIAGTNFGKDSQVSFLVTGTTDPGGVTVKSVKYRNPKSLEATIDVAPDAQTQNRFDIRVQSGGRTGKGTELFSVKVKTTGGDLTPPGTVTDLHAEPVGFNTATLSWTAPADDGYDIASGPAVSWEIRVRKGWTPETRQCGPYDGLSWNNPGATNGGSDDPCQVWHGWGPSGAPGSVQAREILNLDPESPYFAIVRNVDDAASGGNWSNLADDAAHQLSFVTESFPPPPPPISWNTDVVDLGGVVHSFISFIASDVDSYGTPAMLYVKDSAGFLSVMSAGSWQTEHLDIPLDIGNWVFAFAFDPLSGDQTIASEAPASGSSKVGLKFYRRASIGPGSWSSEVVALGSINSVALKFSPVSGFPSIAYSTPAKGSGPDLLKFAQWDGLTWKNETVASGVVGRLDFAFDSSGNPGIAFVFEQDGVRTLRLARRAENAWTSELVDPGPGAPWTRPVQAAITSDPRGGFSVGSTFLSLATVVTAHLRYCEPVAGSWACRTIDQGTLVAGPSIAFGPDGTAFAAYKKALSLLVAVRKPGDEEWYQEYVHWNASTHWPVLRVGADGQPVVAFDGARQPSGVGGSDPVFFAKRTCQE